VVGQPHSARRNSPATRGRHLLRRRAAADLVVASGVDPSHFVVEWGAGTGVLTAELAARARRVEAVELDPSMAQRLRDRFAGDGHVTVVCGDAVDARLPLEPFRVVANIPFHLTSRLLRRLLDDPSVPLLRADLVVQWGAARKRTRTNLSSLRWAPWFDVRVTRRLDRLEFRPPPAVDAAVLVATRRREPLVEDHAAWVRMLERAYARADRPPRPAGELHRAKIDPRARTIDLELDDWLRLFTQARAADRR